jgi:hypothetical protein
MGFISIVQGAALESEYRALVLGRDVRGPLTARAVDAAGHAAGQTSLARAQVSPELSRQLSARRIAAYELHATGLSPQQVYRFEVSDGGPTSTSLVTYTLPRTLPARGMTVAAGTCFYEGFKLGAKLRAALPAARLVEPPLFQLWGGDNLYADVPAFHGQDTPMGFTLSRYLTYFDATVYGSARSLTPNYTTYDDHEFWNNYPESQLWLSRSWAKNRDAYIAAGKECLDLFQASINPPRVADGRSFSFDIAPLSFFFADARSERTLHDAPARRMMTPGDFRALVDWATGLSGPGVLVIGQPWWMETGGKTDYNPPDFPVEYQQVWRLLRDAPFDVLVVTGDVHHSRLLALEFPGAPNRKVYELTTSPVSHIPKVLSSLGFGNAQDQTAVSLPGRVENAGIPVDARYYFGTGAPNTYALIRFVQKAVDVVSVGAAFVDYAGPAPVFPPSDPCGNVADSGHGLTQCVATDLFTLRRR